MKKEFPKLESEVSAQIANSKAVKTLNYFEDPFPDFIKLVGGSRWAVNGWQVVIASLYVVAAVFGFIWTYSQQTSLSSPFTFPLIKTQLAIILTRSGQEPWLLAANVAASLTWIFVFLFPASVIAAHVLNAKFDKLESQKISTWKPLVSWSLFIVIFVFVLVLEPVTMINNVGEKGRALPPNVVVILFDGAVMFLFSIIFWLMYLQSIFELGNLTRKRPQL